MTGPSLFHASGSYLALNLEPRAEDILHAGRHAPAITIARQTGARGVAICTLLHERLAQANRHDSLPWTLFDSELSKEILREHGLPEHLEQFIPEDSVSELDSTINEMLGRHPSLWTLFENTKETISNLAKTGHCILVGRGGNLLTRKLSNVLNVRLIGSRAKRLEHIQESMQLSKQLADALIKKEDNARRGYIKQHYSADIEDPANYDLIVNTDQITDEQACRIIMEALPAEH